MIVKETQPGYIFSRKYLGLSDDEQVRLKEICAELRVIFNADSVDFVQPNFTLSSKNNYEIKIYNGDIIGYMLDGEI